MDHRGRVVEWNPAAERTFGYSRQEAVGQEMAALIIPPALRDVHRQGLARYLQTGQSYILGQRIELTALHASGREFPVELTVTRVTREGGPIFAGYVRDITERKQAERAVEQSEQRFRSLIENSWDAITLIAADGTTIYATPSSTRVLGYSPAELVGRSGLDLIHPEDRERTQGLLAEVLAAPGATVTIEYRIRTKDGSWRWVEGVGTNLLHEPAVNAIVTNNCDIHERKLAEEALRREEARLRDILSHTPAVIFIKDLEGRYVLVNRQHEKLFHVPQVEIIGKTDYEVFPREVAEAFREHDRQVLTRGAPLELEEVAPHDDGPHTYISSKFPLLDAEGNPYAVCGIATDITERKRLEVQLAGSEEQFRTLVEQCPLSVQILAPDGQTLQVNRAWEELWGVTLADIADYNMLADRQLEAKGIMPCIQRGFAGEATAIPPIVYDPEQTISGRTKHREPERWVRAFIYPVKDDAGAVRKVVLIHEDFTDRKRLEDELRERAQELAELDRRKDQFLAMLSHELRNPLAAISNGLTVLDEMSGQSHQAIRARSIMGRQTRHLTRLVDDLLDVARITHGQITVRPQRITLSDLVNGALAVCGPSVETHGHTLSVTLPSEPVVLHVDPVRMDQVLCNLLDNAAKYSEPGGRIWVEAELDQREQPAHLEIRVRDAGIGIPADLLPRVFDRFTQADQTLDRARGGLGLGLTLVKSIVELHGGSVTASSAGPGQGSEFVVRLPTSAHVRPEEAQPQDEQPRGLRPLRILVVEDNPDAAETLQDLLLIEGHEVRVAHEGPAGLAIAREFQPQVVLLDLGLPGIDGYEVARRLLREPGGAGMALIAVSGYAQEDDRRRSQEAGIEHHLTKPVDFAALRQLLARAAVRS